MVCLFFTKRNLVPFNLELFCERTIILSYFPQQEDFNMDQYQKESAIAAGEQAIKSLREVQKCLNSSSTFGMYDFCTGGNGFSTSMKYGRLMDAKMAAEKANRDLEEFSRKIGDVSIECKANFDVSRFLTVADFTLESSLTSSMVQYRINTAKTEVRKTVKEVQKAMERIKKFQL